MTALKRSAQLVLWLLVAACVVVLALAVVVPRLAGATPYTVLTGSMAPELPPGTLVVVRPADPEDVAVGDVITYQLRSGDPTVVTHRVVSASVLTATGEHVFRTQGDANAAADPEPVQPVQVRGELWYSVPYLGRASTWFTGVERQRMVTGAALLLLGYAAATIATAVRRRSA